MSKNVISLTSGRPVALESAETKALKHAEQEARKAALSTHDEAVLKTLSDLRDMAESGRLEGLVVIARDRQTGFFVQDHQLSTSSVSPGQLHGYLGCLEAMKMEVVELAYMAPTMLPDGSIFNPWSDESSEADMEDQE